MDLEKLNYIEWKSAKYCDIKVVELEYAAELQQSFEYTVMLEIGKLQKQLGEKGINSLDEIFDGMEARIHEQALVLNGKLSVAKQTQRVFKELE